ncbi:hypothetical protein CK203_076067 [Vitis vinifera]|uniref:Uncharacterized protein n=1 Tax=Vitis vinifera TaxID=29760 RepID=A0A438EM26_VITVI|nr:hypothetical protein CK203_076067 [Vitis vinifera]
MDANSLLCSSNSSKPHFIFNFNHSSSCQFLTPLPTKLLINSKLLSSPRTSLRTSALTVEKPLDKPSEPREMLPRIDKSGRFCSPRAARELALLIAYAACLEGSDPVRLFERRMNARREPGYEFDKDSLLEYNHMSFGGPPVTTETVEEADELLRNNEKESAIGLRVNLEKSELILVGRVENVEELADEFGYKVGKLPSTYLGMPLGAPFKFAATWDGIEERFRKRLVMWKRQYISKGGGLP